MIRALPFIQAAAGTVPIGPVPLDPVLAGVFRSVVLPRATRRTLRLGRLLGHWALADALA